MFNQNSFQEMIVRMIQDSEHAALPRISRVPPFGSSKNTVAADKRRAKKRKAVIRARKLGHA